MASYRYTRDIKPEDPAAEQNKEYSKKEKRQNFWHYHWKWLLLIAPVALVTFFIVDGVTQIKPDLDIAILCPYSMPDPLLRELESQLSPFTTDLNSDGKTVVAVSQIVLPIVDTADPYTNMSGTAHMAAAIQSGDPMLFIVDDTAVQNYLEDFNLFGTKTGYAANGTESLDELSVAYGSLPTLANLQLNVPLEDGNTVNLNPALANFRLGIQPIFGTPLEDNEGAMRRWQAANDFINTISGGAA